MSETPKISGNDDDEFGVSCWCHGCGTKMLPGKAMGQTMTAGEPDFCGQDDVVTLSAGGPGVMIDCLKCPDCGLSCTL